MKIAIKAEPRTLQGTGASRRLRRTEKVPGVLYGGGKDALAIELDHKELLIKLKQEAFHASVLDMEVGDEKSQVLLRDYQMHPVKPRVLHVDFQRVAADKKIHMKVPLHFINAEVSPGVKIAGGLVQHVINELEVRCLPKSSRWTSRTCRPATRCTSPRWRSPPASRRSCRRARTRPSRRSSSRAS
jgi:large subunit ribosomal protein L25